MTIHSKLFSRRYFLGASSCTAGAAGLALIPGQLLAQKLAKESQTPSQVWNVWTKSTHTNNWQYFYDKVKRVVDQQHKAATIQRYKNNEKVLLLLETSNSRPFPCSADPKLVYGVIRVLVENFKVEPNNISVAVSDKLAEQNTFHTLGFRRAIDYALQDAKRLGEVNFVDVHSSAFNKQTVKSKAESRHSLEMTDTVHQSDHIWIIAQNGGTDFGRFKTTLEVAASLVQPGTRSGFNSKKSLLDALSIQPELADKWRFTLSSTRQLLVTHNNEIRFVEQHPGLVIAASNWWGHDLLASANHAYATQLANSNRSPNQNTELEKLNRKSGLPLLWVADSVDAPEGYVTLIANSHLRRLDSTTRAFS